jgi:tricorn protease
MRHPTLAFVFLAIAPICLAQSAAQSNRGYYRYPAISGTTVAFTAEGDLWMTTIDGGVARRLTTHPGDETHASFSPDGKTIAYSANYEGPTEVYTMPSAGGLPTRRTFDGAVAQVAGWTPDGKILYATRRYSKLPDMQLFSIDSQNHIQPIPLSQASQGVYDSEGHTLFFTRRPFQGSEAKRYEGGTAQNLWKFTSGSEAVALTADFPGTSKDAMWWNGRVYFASDRDGTMNLWSMDPNGRNLKQLTHHQGWDLQSPSLSQGRIVYQLGADLHLFDIASGTDKTIPIELASDFDHLREHWVTKPLDFTTAMHISPDGESVIATSRGRVFVIPVKNGRLVDIAERKPMRFRDARMMPDGKTLLVISTQTGETEFWKIPANGEGPAEQLTTGGTVLRWDGVPSPDGKWIAHQDKDNQLWLFEIATKTQKKIDISTHGDDSSPQFGAPRWSPDSRWISYSKTAANQFDQLFLYNVESGQIAAITTDRYNSNDAAWSADGKWIYFLSDRSLKTVVNAPWGSRNPDPYFDRARKIYQLPLRKGLRSPFEPPDELHPDKPEKATDSSKEPPKVEIDLDGIAARLQEVPAPTGNYTNLTATAKRLCWENIDPENRDKTALECLDIGNKGDKPESLTDGVRTYELSADGKKLFIRKQNDLYVVDSSIRETAMRTPKTIADSHVDLKDWTFSVIPSDEFREEFLDSWRLHRDYFYDRHMHAVNWTAMRDKYGELIGRVRDRQELSDLLAQMVGELSALHTFVRGGDIRRGPDQVQTSSLGALLERDPSAGGYVIQHIYKSDPDRPDKRPPLARPGVDVSEGDVIVVINGRDALSTGGAGELLRNEAGKQVLLRVKPNTGAEARDVLVRPVSMQDDLDLRYREWEFTRREKVEEASHGTMGYVHLRAMTSNDINQWEEEYYPVFDRQGLIIDVRHNQGGNIDSWILGKLLRKAWMYWQPRVGDPFWNMQAAFRGHLVLLVDEWTASDGEAFAEGFRRLGLGKIIGVRTWGGEIWLSGSNFLMDRGVTTAAENGVFGPEGKWLIEGHGVDPDIVVDNLPNATFNGKDAQLEAAIQYLQDLIRKEPIPAIPVPPYPDKTYHPRGSATPTGGTKP